MSATVSEAVRRLNPGVFGGVDSKSEPCDLPQAVQDVHRTRLDATNRSERDFLQVCRRLHAGRDCALIVQPPRLFELEGGGTYTPDVLAITPGGAVVYEVKGGYRGPGWEQGYERYRRAAAQWAGPSLVFVLATRDKNAAGGWRLETWRDRDGQQ